MDLSKAGVASAGEREEMGAPEFTIHWQEESCTFLLLLWGKARKGFEKLRALRCYN